MDSDDEEETEKETIKGPKFPIAMYRTEGNKYLRLAMYNKAIEFFDRALEFEPKNVMSLLGRSKCKMGLANYAEAKQNALEVLKIYSKSSDAKLLVGEAEYFLGDFEKSFLTFYRAYAERPSNEKLKLGYQMCQKAIENALKPDNPIAIGEKDVNALSDIELDQDEDKEKVSKDSFSCHINFLTNLLNDDSVESVHPDCQDLLCYLKERQKFWRTQNPETFGKK